MLLSVLVETSRRIAATSKRLAKIDLLAMLLTPLNPEETRIAVAYLSGATPQGKIGIGYSAIRSAAGSPAESPSLSLTEVDHTLTTIAGIQGSGSTRRRAELLQ